MIEQPITPQTKSEVTRRLQNVESQKSIQRLLKLRETDPEKLFEPVISKLNKLHLEHLVVDKREIPNPAFPEMKSLLDSNDLDLIALNECLFHDPDFASSSSKEKAQKYRQSLRNTLLAELVFKLEPSNAILHTSPNYMKNFKQFLGEKNDGNLMANDVFGFSQMEMVAYLKRQEKVVQLAENQSGNVDYSADLLAIFKSVSKLKVDDSEKKNIVWNIMEDLYGVSRLAYRSSESESDTSDTAKAA